MSEDESAKLLWLHPTHEMIMEIMMRRSMVKLVLRQWDLDRQAERLVRDDGRASFRDDAVTDYMIADITTKSLSLKVVPQSIIDCRCCCLQVMPLIISLYFFSTLPYYMSWWETFFGFTRHLRFITCEF